jgi:hypothetical protein
LPAVALRRSSREIVDGARPSPSCDLTPAHTGAIKIRDLDALILGEEPGADLAHRQPIQRRHEADDLAGTVLAIALRPVPPRRPRDPDFAGGSIDAQPAFSKLHEPATLGRQRATPRPLLDPTRC